VLCTLAESSFAWWNSQTIPGSWERRVERTTGRGDATVRRALCVGREEPDR
jgi:hypothetical protein